MPAYCHPFPSLSFKHVIWDGHQKDKGECSIQAKTPTWLFSHYLNQLRHPRPNMPDVRNEKSENSCHAFT